jgi:hypothetical protein
MESLDLRTIEEVTTEIHRTGYKDREVISKKTKKKIITIAPDQTNVRFILEHLDEVFKNKNSDEIIELTKLAELLEKNDKE